MFQNTISQFCNLDGKEVNEIRNHLPYGFENFKITLNGVDCKSYYEFIDYLADFYPHNCHIKTCYSTISYNTDTCRWNYEDGEYTDSGIELVHYLNLLTTKMATLRNFKIFMETSK